MDYRTATLDELLDRIASERAAPAGGSTAAVVAAVGAALCEMGCVHPSGALVAVCHAVFAATVPR